MSLPVWGAGRDVLAVKPPPPVRIKPGSVTAVSLRAELTPGYHINSHAPSDEYLIPLRLSWSPGPAEVVKISFPEPRLETYQFSEKPLSVFTGDFDITTTFRLPAGVEAGRLPIEGSLRYQACSDRMCLPPRTIAVQLVLEIE